MRSGCVNNVTCSRDNSVLKGHINFVTAFITKPARGLVSPWPGSFHGRLVLLRPESVRNWRMSRCLLCCFVKYYTFDGVLNNNCILTIIQESKKIKNV